jgi:hypothetical protein
VSFCGDPDFSTDFTPERSDDERTLLLDTSGYTVPNDVEKIAIKYGPYIDVFDYTGQESVEVGTDDAVATFEHDGGNEYVNADTGETVDWDSKHFCNGLGGCKYEFPDRTAGGWEDCRSTSDGGGPERNDNDQTNSGPADEKKGKEKQKEKKGKEKQKEKKGKEKQKGPRKPNDSSGREDDVSGRSFLPFPFGGDR